MEKNAIIKWIGIGVSIAYILYLVIKYFIGRHKDKSRMKKLRQDLGLDESQWRKDNWNKSVPHSSEPAPPGND